MEVPRKVIRRDPIAGIDDVEQVTTITRVVKRLALDDINISNKVIRKSSKGVAKKAFSKPGQRYETPKETDALYRFYYSLLKQKPDSHMAIKWCLEHGVFSCKKATSLMLSHELSTKVNIK